MEGRIHEGAGFPKGTHENRRASVVIKETAQLLDGLNEDENRCNALMAELEALLAASQAASGSATCQGASLKTVNFTTMQPLEFALDEGDEDYKDEEDESPFTESLSTRRLKTLCAVHRTASVMTPENNLESALCIRGTSASFTARHVNLPPPQPLQPPLIGGRAAPPPAEWGRRALSFSPAAGGGSFTLSRSAPSQPNLKLGTSTTAPQINMTWIPRDTASTASGDGAEPPLPPPPLPVRGNPSQPPAASEHRSGFIAWAVRRAPSKQRSTSILYEASSARPLSPSPPSWALPLSPTTTTAKAMTTAACDAMAPKESSSSSTLSLFRRRMFSKSQSGLLPHLGRRASENTILGGHTAPKSVSGADSVPQPGSISAGGGGSGCGGNGSGGGSAVGRTPRTSSSDVLRSFRPGKD